MPPVFHSTVIQIKDLNSMSFPEKKKKKLPTGFSDEADTMSAEDLKKVIVESEGNIYTVEKEKELDTKLSAAKDLVKDLSSSYKEAISTMRAKIDYCLYLLEENGSQIGSPEEEQED